MGWSNVDMIVVDFMLVSSSIFFCCGLALLPNLVHASLERKYFFPARPCCPRSAIASGFLAERENDRG